MGRSPPGPVRRLHRPCDERRSAFGSVELVRHKQILDRLAIGQIPEVVQDEVNGLAGRSFIYAKHAGHQGARYDDVVPRLLRRWSGLLDATDATYDRMIGHQVAIALATCLHQVGLVHEALTDRAVAGIPELNEGVWLSDTFERQSPEITGLLRSTPTALTRRPPTRETVTFTRPGDLLAIRTSGRYVIGHVHGDTAINQAPIIELYATTFEQLPAPDDVVGTPAAGVPWGDGPPSIDVLWVYGLRHIPDPAEQIHLIGVAQTTPPDHSHLADRGTMGTGSDLYDFLDRAAEVAAR